MTSSPTPPPIPHRRHASPTPALIAMWLALIACAACLRVAMAPAWVLATPILGGALVHAFLRPRARRRTPRQSAPISRDARPPTEPRVVPDPGKRDDDLTRRVEASEIEIGNLRGVLDAVDEPVLTLGPDGAILLVNAAARRLLGARLTLDAEPVLLEDLLPQAEIRELTARAARGVRATGRVRISRPHEGLRVYDVYAAPLTLRASDERPGRGAVICLRDTTELATAVQLKTDFVANASHELRTPLSSIRAAAETLTDFGDEDPAMLRRMATLITGNVTRLEELVADLLDLSRIESPDAPVEIEEVDLVALCASIAELFEGAGRERRVGLIIDVAPELARARTSRRLLEAAIKNLVDNAIKFARADTDVRIHAEALAPIAPGEPHAGWRGGRVEVVDRGVGIPLDQQARVFERFHQVDPSRSGTPRRRGTGLGLAIVKHAVRKLGGSVGVDSVWREGSTFWIELPALLPPGETEPGNTALSPDATSGAG